MTAAQADVPPDLADALRLLLAAVRAALFVQRDQLGRRTTLSEVQIPTREPTGKALSQGRFKRLA